MNEKGIKAKSKEPKSISMNEFKKVGTKKDYSKMSIKELKAEKAKIEMQLEYKADNSSMLRTVELLYNALASQFMYHMKYELPSLYVFRTRRNKNLFSLLEKVTRFLDRWLFRALNKRPTMKQRSRLYVIFADLIIENLNASRYAPTTLRTVLNSHEMFPSLFEKAFPGYIRGGAIDMILATNKIHFDAEDLE